MKLKVTVDGKEYEVDVEVQEEATPSVDHVIIGAGGGGVALAAAPAAAPVGDADGIAATLAGNVVKIPVSEGDEVKEGDVVMVIEAMKMETEVLADQDGKVEKIHVAVGDAVKPGQGLLKIV